MFKFSLPITILLSSSSCLTLFAIGSLLLMNSNTVHTRDINQTSTDSHETLGPPSLAQAMSLDKSTDTNRPPIEPSMRRRSGRLFNQSVYGSATSPAAGASQQTLDSYAAAYAAANSPASSASDQAASGQLIQQVSDANIYSSFGDVPPTSQVSSSSSGSAAAAAARQVADYGGPHSSYYASYMSPSTNEATYSSGQQQQHLHHHHQQQLYSPSHHHHRSPMGYPTNAAYDRSNYYADHYAGHYQPAASSPFWASSSSLGSTGGLMSSASTALSHWTNGFSISEIVCGLVALAIGAVILGAPFFLIYLALMGNFSGSGTLSLTNPTQGAATPGGASTTVNGRRKRLAIFEQSFNMDNDNKKNRTSDYVALSDSLISHLSPFVNFQQVTGTFKQLIDSIEKYSHLKNEPEVSQSGKEKSF